MAPPSTPIAAYLDRLDRELRLKRAPRRRLLAEVEDHLRSCAADLVAGGREPETAERVAVEQFGAAATVAGRFAQVVASGTARRSAAWAAGLWALSAAGLASLGGAAPEYADFPQGAPSALLIQVALVAVAVSGVRGLRWRREALVPEDRLRLLANGALIASGALGAALVLETLIALTRPAGILHWREEPAVFAVYALAVAGGLVALAYAGAAALRSATLEALPSGGRAASAHRLTLADDAAALVPAARRLIEAACAHPLWLVGGIASAALAVSAAGGVLALGLVEAVAIIAGSLALGRPLGIKAGRVRTGQL